MGPHRRSYCTYGKTHDLHRLRPTVTPLTEFVLELLANRRAASVARKRSDVDEDLRTTLCGCDEAEATFVVPTAKRAGDLHGEFKSEAEDPVQ